MTSLIDPAVRDFAAERGLSVDRVSQYVEETLTGFITTMLWSESCRGSAPTVICDHFGKVGEDAGECDRSLEYLNYGESDLAGAAYDEIRGDVVDFVIANWDDLMGDGDERLIDAGQAGQDFLLTRNGHGAGFWDRGLGERGDRLTANAKPYGETNAYVGDDELIYV